MTDSTYNLLVTLLLIAAGVIAFMYIFGHGFSTSLSSTTPSTQVSQYAAQPASASVIEVFRDRPVQQSSTTTSYTYVVPSTQYQTSSYYRSSSQSYSCDWRGHCYTY